MKYCTDCKHFKIDKFGLLLIIFPVMIMVAAVVIVGWPMLLVGLPITVFAYFVYMSSVQFGKCSKCAYSCEDGTNLLSRSFDTWMRKSSGDNVKREFYYASSMRKEFGKCGREARLFEPKKTIKGE